MTADRAAAVQAVRTMLDVAGLTLDDLHSELAAAPETADRVTYPTLAGHIADFEASLTRNTRRTWATHYRRLLDGVAPQCECTCPACLDVAAGCGCDCRACAAKVGIDACGETVLRPRSVSASDVRRWATVAQRLAAKKATTENAGRAAHGLAAKPAHGHGGRENAVTAYRALFAALVDDEVWDANPAMRVTKPKRNDTRKRGLRDDEIGPFLDAVATGGDDPDLDVLLCWAHLETGARRNGLLTLTVGRLHRASQTVELYEKGSKLGEQPVSAELLAALAAHAIERGGPECDPADDRYDPTRSVLYYRHPVRSPDRPDDRPAPLSARRYDTLFRRVQRQLPWANEISLSAHGLRKTAASIVERVAGTQTARLFLRHGRRNTTETYVESWQERLAAAVVVMTGRPHPAAPEASRRLAAPTGGDRRP